jgi:hypothetical protein
MKVLIQDSQSKRYLTASGEWVKDAHQGEDFESHRRAFVVAQQARIAEFNIMLYSAIGRYLFRVDHGQTENAYATAAE